MKRGLILAAVAFLGAGSALRADTFLTGNLTVDNDFNAYLSTSDSQLGILIGSGPNWEVTSSLTSTLLSPGQTYYLHIDAINEGGPAMFIGDFSLSNTDFQFANGSQELLTEVIAGDLSQQYWQVSDSGFGSGYYTPVDEGAYGTSPWGDPTDISSSAHFLWGTDFSNGPDDSGEEFFSTKITPLTSAVPLPAALPAASLLLAGLAGLQLRRRHA